MADEQQDTGADEAPETETPAEDPIKNLKAEMARKHSNLEAQQAETNAQLQAILAEVQKSMKGPEAPKKSARELVFDDPEEFVRTVKEEAVREATESVGRANQASQKVQQEVNSFTSKYPEFAQEGSEAVLLATKYAQELPSRLKGTAEGVFNAMSRAALELGLQQVSKRKSSSSDEPVVGARSSGGSSPARKPGKIDDKTLQFAELLGMDLTDPKQKATLEAASSRKKWSSYE